MKQRINISDEEIRHYMDFEGLMAKQKKAGSNPIHAFLKWSIPLLAVIGISFWILLTEPVSAPEETPAPLDELYHVKSDKSQPSGAEVQEPTGIAKEDRIMQQPKVAPRNDSTKLSKKSDEFSVQQQEAVYQQAEPVDGYVSLYDYFSTHLVYPAEAVKDSVQGVLTVTFIITKEGKPEIVTINNVLGESFEKEAIRLIQNMPPWKPATLNGKPVSSKISLPLTFQLQKIKQ